MDFEFLHVLRPERESASRSNSLTLITSSCPDSLVRNISNSSSHHESFDSRSGQYSYENTSTKSAGIFILRPERESASRSNSLTLITSSCPDSLVRNISNSSSHHESFDPRSGQYSYENTSTKSAGIFILRPERESNSCMSVLQTEALPLRHLAIKFSTHRQVTLRSKTSGETLSHIVSPTSPPGHNIL